MADETRVVEIIHLLHVLQHVRFLHQALVYGFAKLLEIVIHPIAPGGLDCSRRLGGFRRLRRGRWIGRCRLRGSRSRGWWVGCSRGSWLRGNRSCSRWLPSMRLGGLHYVLS